ncbi:hypothetical protein Trco_006971 [Trichoderma cornu-damae]|uniref:Uncharacterized protein n=1 Tax=Trichoderma cornu-damae TaxID=654480 RepID=A0A9P8QHR1_9HYPO|nr:hypothetical protein Trco_006971 [Trichoderma cornu-damae]
MRNVTVQARKWQFALMEAYRRQYPAGAQQFKGRFESRRIAYYFDNGVCSPSLGPRHDFFQNIMLGEIERNCTQLCRFLEAIFNAIDRQYGPDPL